MPSLFDPAALELGFKKIFGILFASATVTLIYIFYLSSSIHLESAIVRDAIKWWNASTFIVRAIGVLAACTLYIGVVFYAALTVYDYLLAKKSSESTTKN